MHSLALRGVGLSLTFLALVGITGRASAQTGIVQGTQNIVIWINSGGTYNVVVQDLAWELGGDLGVPATNITVSSSSDAAGPYNQIDFDFVLNDARHGFIRAYTTRPAVLFSSSFPSGGANANPFPTLSRYPKNLQHMTYSGSFSIVSFPGFGNQSPWTFFDSAANTFILSPASHFLSAWMDRNAQQAIESGINPQITTLPPGFQQSTLLVAGKGINNTFDLWGHTMTGLRNKTRPSNETGIILQRLGYWTDNGATYYYHTAPNLSYTDTLNTVKAGFDQAGIALGYMQLDSWFYPKGLAESWSATSGGIYLYEGASNLFAQDIRGFQRQIGIPLVTHARWIDPASPYQQQYQMSASVSIDPLYWSDVSKYLQNSGVAVYEQDWLGANAQTKVNLNDPDLFLDGMASAMAHNGLDIQYCMGTPAHFMQSVRYSNLTTARTSEDRFDRPRWTKFLYSSRLAGALGIWPFTDVFMSGEFDNLLMATLSAGPVGIGDAIGALNAGNLLHAVRRDGVIVKPDAPLTPVDATYFDSSADMNAPMVASTYTSFGRLRAHYVFAYDQGVDSYPALTFSALGVTGPVYVYDYYSDTGALAAPGDLFQPAVGSNRVYKVIAQVGPSGIALLGDLGHFVTLGKQRIPWVEDNGKLRFKVSFAEGEASRTIQGYASSPPSAFAREGSVGPVQYDLKTHRFRMVVSPATGGMASVEMIPGA